MVVEHTIPPAGAGRIRLTAKHVQVRGAHDRPRLITGHRGVAIAAIAPPGVAAGPARAVLIVTALIRVTWLPRQPGRGDTVVPSLVPQVGDAVVDPAFGTSISIIAVEDDLSPAEHANCPDPAVEVIVNNRYV